MDSKVIEVSFNTIVPENYVEEFNNVIRNRLDEFINLEKFPMVGSVYNAKTKELNDNDPIEIWNNHESCVITFKFFDINHFCINMRDIFVELSGYYFNELKEALHEAEPYGWVDYKNFSIHILNRNNTNNFKGIINDLFPYVFEFNDTENGIDNVLIGYITEFSDGTNYYITRKYGEKLITSFDYETVKMLADFKPWYRIDK